MGSRAARRKRAVRVLGNGGVHPPGSIWEGAFRRRWLGMCAKAGIRPVTFHILRHTAARLGLEDGTPLHVVTATLGHTKPETPARLYAHLTHPSMVALADAIDARFGARPRVLPDPMRESLRESNRETLVFPMWGVAKW
jgi:integrase